MATYDQGGGCACGLYKVCCCEPKEEQKVTHNLEKRYPLVASLKYRCDCANNEVLAISVVLGTETTEEQFVWTMKQLWRDTKLEVEKHLQQKPTTPEAAASEAEPDKPWPLMTRKTGTRIDMTVGDTRDARTKE